MSRNDKGYPSAPGPNPRPKKPTSDGPSEGD